MKTLEELGFIMTNWDKGVFTHVKKPDIIQGTTTYTIVRLYSDGTVEIDSGLTSFNQELFKAIEHEMLDLGWWE